MGGSSGPRVRQNVRDPFSSENLERAIGEDTVNQLRIQSEASREAREASFGRKNAGTLGEISRGQLENDLFKQLVSSKTADLENRQKEEQRKKDEREETLARIRAQREQAQKLRDRPGQSQFLLASRAVGGGSSSFLTGGA